MGKVLWLFVRIRIYATNESAGRDLFVLLGAGWVEWTRAELLQTAIGPDVSLLLFVITRSTIKRIDMRHPKVHPTSDDFLTGSF